MRHLTVFSIALFLSVIGLTPATRAGGDSSDSPSAGTELEAKYPRAPKTLDGDPIQSSVLLLEFEFDGIGRLQGLDGATLVMATNGGVIRARPMKGRLVMFNPSDPGTYSLRFIRVSNYNAKIAMEVLPAPEMNVTVARGSVSYLGTIVVSKMFGGKPMKMDLVHDAEKEMAAWSTFKEKYPTSPWSALAEQRIASLKSASSP